MTEETIQPTENFTNVADPAPDVAADAREQTILLRDAKKRAIEANRLSDQSNRRDKASRLGDLDIQARKGRRAIVAAVGATGGVAMQGIAATLPPISQQSAKPLGMAIAVVGKAIGVYDSIRDFTDIMSKKKYLLEGSRNKPPGNTDAAPGSAESRADAGRTGRDADQATPTRAAAGVFTADRDTGGTTRREAGAKVTGGTPLAPAA